jgi:hypothetical protein
LPLIGNVVTYYIVLPHTKLSTISLENPIECSALTYKYVNETQGITTYFEILEAEDPAVERMNARRLSVKFQNFSLPPHST